MKHAPLLCLALALTACETDDDDQAPMSDAPDAADQTTTDAATEAEPDAESEPDAGAAPECVDGETRCADEAVERCEEGAWAADYACPEGVRCAEGACAAACDPGATRCGGDTVYACDEAGEAYAPIEVCPEGCVDGACGEAPSECYEGPEGTEGVGVCRAGATEGGACAGQVLPAEEACNELDDDCDGATDEDLEGCGEEPMGCPDAPQPETCNGVDDDCDDAVDESIYLPSEEAHDGGTTTLEDVAFVESLTWPRGHGLAMHGDVLWGTKATDRCPDTWGVRSVRGVPNADGGLDEVMVDCEPIPGRALASALGASDAGPLVCTTTHAPENHHTCGLIGPEPGMYRQTLDLGRLETDRARLRRYGDTLASAHGHRDVGMWFFTLDADGMPLETTEMEPAGSPKDVFRWRDAWWTLVFRPGQFTVEAVAGGEPLALPAPSCGEVGRQSGSGIVVDGVLHLAFFFDEKMAHLRHDGETWTGRFIDGEENPLSRLGSPDLLHHDGALHIVFGHEGGVRYHRLDLEGRHLEPPIDLDEGASGETNGLVVGPHGRLWVQYMLTTGDQVADRKLRALTPPR